VTLHQHPTATATPPFVQRRRRWDQLDLRHRGDVSAYLQGSLALTFPLPSGLEAEPGSSALTVVGADVVAQSTVPDPQVWASRFLQAVVEVISSDRPLTQLVRWTDSEVFADISRRRHAVAAARSELPPRSGRQQVASVHICRPSMLVAEVAARVSTGSRSRALAARLDFHRERWLCTALDFG
jgi:Family of unknown function (DUF6459)